MDMIKNTMSKASKTAVSSAVEQLWNCGTAVEFCRVKDE